MSSVCGMIDSWNHVPWCTAVYKQPNWKAQGPEGLAAQGPEGLAVFFWSDRAFDPSPITHLNTVYIRATESSSYIPDK